MEYHDYREINQRANFQLRNIQFSMPCYMQNTFQTKFSLQDSVYHFCNVKLYLLLQLLLFKPLQRGFLPEEKKNKRKSRLTKSRRDKTILFTKSGANRLEQLISIGCSKVWRGSRDRRPGALDLLAARRLYTGVVGGCTRGSFEQRDG